MPFHQCERPILGDIFSKYFQRFYTKVKFVNHLPGVQCPRRSSWLPPAAGSCPQTRRRHGSRERGGHGRGTWTPVVARIFNNRKYLVIMDTLILLIDMLALSRWL